MPKRIPVLKDSQVSGTKQDRRKAGHKAKNSKLPPSLPQMLSSTRDRRKKNMTAEKENAKKFNLPKIARGK